MEKQHVNNIVALVKGASAQQYLDGLTWYSAAHDLAAHLAVKYGVTIRQSAGVIAAVSPQTAWQRNMQLAEKYLSQHAAGITPNGGYMRVGINKVIAILSLADPSEDEILDVLKAQKISAFFLNIMNDSWTVTVDGHAINAMLSGFQRYGITDKKGCGQKTITPKQWEYATEVYREAARYLHLTPCETQAIAWVVYRDLPKGE